MASGTGQPCQGGRPQNRGRWRACAGLLLAGLGLLGCGGAAPGSAVPDPPAALRLLPASSVVKAQGEVHLQATDAQGQPVAASYSVVESRGGSVDASGRYLAPATPGTFHVQAWVGGRPLAQATVTVEGFRATLQRQVDLIHARVSHSASLLDDGSVLVAGGIDSSVAERFLPASQSFEPVADLGQRRWSHSASALPGGAVLLLGGLGIDAAQNALRPLDSAICYQAGGFTALQARLAVPRFDHRAATLADGRVLISGGLPATGSEISALISCEVFDPLTRQFRATGSLSLPRTGHTATTLLDGRVLVAGGRDGTCLFQCSPATWRSAELYDPVTGTFSAAGAMAQARFGHSATLLPDGKVLIAGGTTPDLADTDVSDLVELYDPVSNRFQILGRMLRPRSEHSATLLGDGRVLLAGGLTFGHGEGTLATATVEALDPATGQSQLAVSGLTTRYRHSAVRLASGQVLLLGGTEGGGSIRLVELYD